MEIESLSLLLLRLINPVLGFVSAARDSGVRGILSLYVHLVYILTDYRIVER